MSGSRPPLRDQHDVNQLWHPRLLRLHLCLSCILSRLLCIRTVPRLPKSQSLSPRVATLFGDTNKQLAIDIFDPYPLQKSTQFLSFPTPDDSLYRDEKVRKGKLEEAMKTLQKLRGSSYRGVEEEVAAILHHLIIPSSYTIFTYI